MTSREVLEHKHISPSITRVAILDYFKDKNHHPSADEIYRSLKDTLPTLSKTTVYNVLNLFTENELVKHVNIKGTDQLYELGKKPHSHLKCNKCGKIFDVPAIDVTYSNKNLDGFIVNDEEVTLTGICKACQKK